MKTVGIIMSKDSKKTLAQNFAHEAGVTCKGIGNVAIILAPVFAIAALTSQDTSGLGVGLNAMAAGASAAGGFALRYAGDFISRFEA